MSETERGHPQPQEISLKAMGEALKRKARAFYDRPIPPGTRKVMHRILGEAVD